MGSLYLFSSLFGYNTFITGVDPQMYFPFPGDAVACLVLHLTSQKHLHSNLVQKEDCTNLSQSFLNWSS